MTSEDSLRKLIATPTDIKQVTIGDYNINYIVAGTGPNLLLIHGGNIGWGAWYPNIDELAKYFTIYALDLPGAGRSTSINYRTLNPEQDFLQIAEKFFQILEIKNFNIIGSSIGGWVALRLALKYPKLVNKLIITDSVGFGSRITTSEKIIGSYPLAKFISKTALNPKKRDNIEKFLKEILYNKNFIFPKEFIDYFWDTMKTSHNLLLISRLNSIHNKLNLEKELPNILNKTLIIWGEQDTIMPLKKTAFNFKLIPNAQVSIINNTGHMPSLEKPKEFNNIVKNFLTKAA